MDFWGESHCRKVRKEGMNTASFCAFFLDLVTGSENRRPRWVSLGSVSTFHGAYHTLFLRAFSVRGGSALPAAEDLLLTKIGSECLRSPTLVVSALTAAALAGQSGSRFELESEDSEDFRQNKSPGLHVFSMLL
jgi:hypothetical protein